MMRLRIIPLVSRQQFGTNNAVSNAWMSSSAAALTGDPSVGSKVPPTPMNDNIDNPPINKNQLFVKTRLKTGEWNMERTDPIYRPTYLSTAKIIAADDFANRPLVSETGEFENFTDAMTTLSFLDTKSQKQIYTVYQQLIVSCEKDFSITSHEYVMRVVAQKFNITPARAAAAVQLQHNEEQIIKEDPDFPLLVEECESMEKRIATEISQAYSAHKLAEPQAMFVEDPVGVNEYQEGKKFRVADDILDVDKITEDSEKSEKARARRILDDYMYIEDVDEETIPVPISKDAMTLLEQKKKFAAAMEADQVIVNAQRAKSHAAAPPYRTVRGESDPQRPRYTFVCQTANTYEQKRNNLMQRKKHASNWYTNNSPQNTLVEEVTGDPTAEDVGKSTLRNANMADVRHVAWKPVRHTQEHIYRGAKLGYLDMKHRSKPKAWGAATEEETQNFFKQAISAQAERAAARKIMIKERAEWRKNNPKPPKKSLQKK